MVSHSDPSNAHFHGIMATKPPFAKPPDISSKLREVLHGVGAEGVGVKFPIFAVNYCCLPLSFRRRREKRRKTKKNEEKRKKAKKMRLKKMRKKKGKITPTPSTPTPLRTSQKLTRLYKVDGILSGHLDRSNAILSLLYPLDCYTTLSVIGSAVVRPISPYLASTCRWDH